MSFSYIPSIKEIHESISYDFFKNIGLLSQNINTNKDAQEVFYEIHQKIITKPPPLWKGIFSYFQIPFSGDFKRNKSSNNRIQEKR